MHKDQQPIKASKNSNKWIRQMVMKLDTERVGKWGDILAAPENEDQTVTMMRKISIQKHDFPLAWVAITSNTDVLRAEVCISMSDKECRERFAAQEVAIVGFNDDTFMCGITRVKDVVSWIAYDLPANRELDTDSWLAADKGNVDKFPLKQRPFLTKKWKPMVWPTVTKMKWQICSLKTDEAEGNVKMSEVVNLLRVAQSRGSRFEGGKDGTRGVERLMMRTLTLLERETSQKASIVCRQARKPIEPPIWTFNGMLTTSNHVDRKKRTFRL
ncbi:hypothetical protein C8R43DRAFT_942019 [Mycena crocata]|nr:hypothetical protein C8R43DRAFT_942019 [Mycena crocata]